MTASMKRPNESHDQNGKRVKFGSNEVESENGMESGETHDKLNAREVVELRLVTSARELTLNNAMGKQNKEKTFPPKYLHQIFPDEKIEGYAMAKLAIYYDPLSLHTCLWENSKKLPLDEGDAVVEVSQFGSSSTQLNVQLASFIKGGLCATREEFNDILAVRDEYIAPVSNLQHRYTIRGEKYGVYKEKLGDEKSAMYQFHERIKFFMFIHIEGASWIDGLDPRWEIYFIHRLDEKNQPREFVGFATTYPFSVLKSGTKDISFSERLRISQVLVMPHAQGRGHGTRLLNAICKEAKNRGCLEVTVEDPSHGFRILRDLTDLRRAYGEGILKYKETFEFGTEDEIITEMRKALQITKSQARRCIEVHAMVDLDFENEDEYKKYRLWVKRRLHRDYVDVVEHLAVKEKKVKLAELYSDVESEYRIVIQRLESRGHRMPDSVDNEESKEAATK